MEHKFTAKGFYELAYGKGIPIWDRWLGHNAPESPACQMEAAGMDSVGLGMEVA